MHDGVQVTHTGVPSHGDHWVLLGVVHGKEQLRNDPKIRQNVKVKGCQCKTALLMQALTEYIPLPRQGNEPSII